MTRACMVLVLIWLVSRGGETLANSSQDEISDNTVEVTFYLVSSSQWSQSADFQQVLSTQATTYCQGELKECGLVEQVQFQPGNINISDGYPREENRNLVLQFCILYPSGARLLNNSVTKQVLPRSVTYAVSGLADTRESFYKKTSYSLIKITAGKDVKEQTPYPNTEMNIIMSIVGVLVLIIVCAIAIGCHCYRQQKDRKARIAKLSKNMKSKQYNNQLNDNKVSPLGTDDIPWEHNRSRDNLRGTEAKVYKEKETKSSRSLSKTVGKPNNALPPVETGVGSEKKKKKKRKKKKVPTATLR